MVHFVMREHVSLRYYYKGDERKFGSLYFCKRTGSRRVNEYSRQGKRSSPELLIYPNTFLRDPPSNPSTKSRTEDGYKHRVLTSNNPYSGSRQNIENYYLLLSWKSFDNCYCIRYISMILSQIVSLTWYL